MSIYKIYKSGEEEFDNKVKELHSQNPQLYEETEPVEFGYSISRDDELFRVVDFGNIKQFIKQQYISIIKGEIERLEKEKTEQDESDFESDYDDQMEAYQQKGYNQALSDQISHLQSELLLIEKDNG